jgi:hypothetical protein
VEASESIEKFDEAETLNAYAILLNFRLQQCAGSHQSIKGFRREDTDLILNRLQRDISSLIYTAVVAIYRTSQDP